nr:TonB-dependent receptor [uncultured Brevundimonas sp.]
MTRHSKFALLATTASAVAFMAAGGALAQAEPIAAEQAAQVDDIVVVGTNIRGARTTAALPVVVADREQIEATGASTGDELLRTIPQMGDVQFDSSSGAQTSNSARGDVNSVNLRSLGVGNTLVLLNGRRVVQHPTSQGTSDTGTVPVLSYNSNAIPVAGLERLEVLLDGAAAIYGADAVAGVVNTVLRDNIDGLSISARYGGAEGTQMRDFETNLFAGKNFDRGNVSIFANYANRTALWASDQDFTRSDNLLPLFADYSDFSNVQALDGRSSHTPWARLSLGARPVIRSNGVNVTNASGMFHYQPSSFGCPVSVGNDICIASGNHNFNTTNRDMRYDTRYDTTVRPSVERMNVFLTGRYDITPDIEAFGEIGYYSANSRAVQPPVVNLNQIWIPASNYYNPFGPTRFADGSLNPNRLPGLTGVPTGGLPVLMTNYRFVDTGFQVVKVDNYQARLLGGLRGEWRGFNWETALLYSEAKATDSSPNINMTALQKQLALSTPDAYNPFSGGCVGTPSYGDCSPSSQAAIDAIVFDMRRVSKTTLSMVDFKLSRGDLFNVPAGQVGMAFGLEARRETQSDDRDENVDGTYTFTDMVTGEKNPSNVSAVSPNPDTKGSRNVFSTYVEFAVPVISPEMNIPLVQRVDLQLAGRYEHYSDFGSVAKPKIAAAWDVIEGVRVRGSYSQGFRAPNLEQTNATQYGRLATAVDYVRCEADLRANRIKTFAECSRPISSASLLVEGNPDLEPEESTNTSYGLVLQPHFIPSRFGRFTFTIDRWRIEQEKIVGLLGAPTAMALDYLYRMQGQTNPLVNRREPTADDTQLFDGTGLAPAGDVVSINDRFINLQPQTVSGLDLAMNWSLRRTRYGTFTVNASASKLEKFTRDPGDVVNELYAARAAGTINAGTTLPDPSQLIGQNGRPEWRVNASLTWRKGPWRAGASSQYVSGFEQPGLLGSSGSPWEVDGRQTINGYVDYAFPDETRVRLGARDLTNEGPPLADNGYRGTVHSPWGRYWYVNVSKTF